MRTHACSLAAIAPAPFCSFLFCCGCGLLHKLRQFAVQIRLGHISFAPKASFGGLSANVPGPHNGLIRDDLCTSLDQDTHPLVARLQGVKA